MEVDHPKAGRCLEEKWVALEIPRAIDYGGMRTIIFFISSVAQVNRKFIELKLELALRE
jgi:hypothetical protein